MSEPLTNDDRLRDEVIAAIAKSGRCYTNEARAMACELVARRGNQQLAGCLHRDAYMRKIAGGVETYCPDCGKPI